MRNHHLRPALAMPHIYLYRTPIDFRKQVNGLAALIEQELGHNPFTGALAEVSRENQLVRIGCWDHARRKYVEAGKAVPKGKKTSNTAPTKADVALGYIGKLYGVERYAPLNQHLFFSH